MEYNQQMNIQDYSGRNASIESTLAEEIARIFEGELSSKETMAHKTLHILNQKDLELTALTDRIRLLEALNANQLAEDRSPTGQGSHRNSCLDGRSNASLNEYSSYEESLEARSEKSQLKRIGVTHPKNKNVEQISGCRASIDKQNLQILNAQLLSAIYNDSQTRKEEQTRFMNIITQLHEIVQTLKGQKEVKNKKIQERCREKDNPNLTEQRKKEEQGCLIESHPVKSDWRQQSFTSVRAQYSDHSLSNSGLSFEDHLSTKMDGTAYRSVKLKTHKKVKRNKLKKLHSKLHKHERFISKSKFLYEELQKQGKTLVSMVEVLRNEQQKDKDLTERLLHKIEEIANSDHWLQFQTIALSQLEDRISKVEQSLTENNSKCPKHEEEIIKLTEELGETKQLKKHLDEINIQIKSELSILNEMLSKERIKVEELIETIEKERALNDSLKQNFEIQLAKLVSNAVAEHEVSYSESKTSLENQIRNLQLENAELKSRIDQMEDDWKKMSNEYKMKSMKAKKFLQTQISIASQKLLFADFKIKEFFLTIEKLLRSLHKCMYEGELETIRKKCNEESGVKAATTILGVSTSEMTKVLAAGALPNIAEWLDTCHKLAYRDKFADELAAFVISLFHSALNKNLNKGTVF